MEKTPEQLRNDKLAQRVVTALQKRHFEAFYCPTRQEALTKALELIPQDHLISWGGSVTLQQIGLLDALRNGDYRILDRETAQTPEEKQQIARAALTCDTYLSGTNGLSEDGQLVNIDGNGNRVAAMIFGPTNVVVVVGINKITKTVEDAMQRAKTIAAPINKQRFPGLKTACEITGSCESCLSPDSICAYFVTTRISRPVGKIKVIIVGENLGY